MSQRKRTRRVPRPLLLAGSGLAILAFGNVACGSSGVAGVTVCEPGLCGPVGTPVQIDEDGGDGGSVAVQYCGLPDGGTPVPCYPDGGHVDPEPDAGPTDGGA
jgi:hypothetical protein